MEGIRINRTTRDVLYRDTYPNIAGDPIPGFGLNDTGPEEWLIVIRENYTGELDQLYWQIQTSEDSPEDRGEHPNYPGVGKWVIRQTKVKLPVADQLINLENNENLNNEQIINLNRLIKSMAVALRGLIRKVNAGQTPTQLEIDCAQYVLRTANKIEQNYRTRLDKSTIIDSEPDMLTGWINEPEPENIT